jgi:hypothetical protein
MNRPALLLALTACLGLLGAALADGPADNVPEKVRAVPPPGIVVPPADRTALEQGLADLSRDIDGLRSSPRADLLPDVIIYQKAVAYALQNGEFFNPRDVDRAKVLIQHGRERAAQLAQGQAPWLHQPGPSARGYVSKIDGSVQPYGLFLPPSYRENSPHVWRLDTWFHGRGETLSEVNFVADMERSGGPFVRPHTFTVQPYGRYCNANKLAGEVDLHEAIADIKKRYRIDPDRIVVRGFSMGGAACWQFAAHNASDWAAAAPGAGFSETPEFLRVFQKEDVQPTWWERKLWQMYDCHAYADNFYNLPTVAYSGENDNQKQAADVMARELGKRGIDLVHVIGPKTGHSYHPSSVPIINGLIDGIADRGRDPLPRRVKLQTPTLKFNRQAWVVVDGMGRHWEPGRVDAEILDGRSVTVRTENVTALSLEMPPGACPLPNDRAPQVTLDGARLSAAPVLSDRSWSAHFRREGSRWKAVPSAGTGDLRKIHDLQGPIDDAFMDSFMIVRPTGTPSAPGTAKWVDAELAHAITEWRRQFRGDARIKNDVDVTDADIAAHNLVLWGDPGSNRLLARVAGKLPIQWSASEVTVGAHRYPAATHAPVLIYPNPLNPTRYVVLNSGFTFREYDYLNNARQVPRLPDWAVVDTTTPPNPRWPGKIVDAGFFGERWELIERREK